MRRKVCKAIAATALVLAGPALADVKAGVDAWGRGDYAAAVREWQGPAEAGDADAMFNLAQAHRLGRGVALDLERAEGLYARAAAAGHIQAADTYGLMLFETGRREAALPFLQAAAGRGDPRAQYLLGVAHFNGDLLERDWVRAYALVSLAVGDGLPQAQPALAEMNAHIPLAQRQEGARLAEQLRDAADAARRSELTAAELAGGAPLAGPSPPLAAARAALDAAGRAGSTGSPGEAGAGFARSAAPPRSVPVPSAPRPAEAVANTGPWRVQLGAFALAENAQALWSRLHTRPELAGRERITVPAGRMTKLQAGGFATRAEAEAACRGLARAGQDCLVTRN